ncbi:MAG: restriction endonuclease subunit S [Ignavibacteriae bacterium]|nr:restriction endonuclease subunit S [Ignavibacteriota bacterium]
MTWQRISLGNVSKVFSGYAFKAKDLTKDKDGISIIKIANIQDKKVLDTCQTYLPKNLYNEKLKKYYLREEDFLIAMTGAGSVGKVGKMVNPKGKFLVNQRVGIVRVNSRLADPRFVYYLLSQDAFENYMYGLGLGAGQPNISPSNISNIEINAPDLQTQRKIASILSAYDDLIENNTRRIKILEEMAQSIYKEWFVNFRFPGHEKVKFVDSELGKIPEGWKIHKFNDVIDMNPRESIDKTRLKKFVGMEKLNTSNMIIDGYNLKLGNSGSKFRNYDVLFARITPSLENGKTGFVQFLENSEIGFGSTELIVFRSKLVNPEYVYFLSRDNEFRQNAINSMVGASGRQRVQNDSLKNYEVVKPSKEYLDMFADLVTPKFRSIQYLHLKNNNLRKTRDLLLPKLMSGEVEV